MLPTLWIFHHAETGTSTSRAFYLLEIPAAVAVAAGDSRLITAGGLGFALVAAVALLLPWTDAAISNLRIEGEAGARTARRTAGIERILAASPNAAVMLIDPDAVFGDIGLRTMPERFAPPFRTDTADVASFASDAEGLASTWWRRTDGSIVAPVG
jgi:hypothetical protein